MWNAPIHIGRVQPWPRAICIRGEIHESASVEQHWMADERILKRNAFERFARRLDAPDIPRIRWHASSKVNEVVFMRPHRKMTVHARRRRINPTGLHLMRIANEQRIARRSGVIDQSRSVAGPGD